MSSNLVTPSTRAHDRETVFFLLDEIKREGLPPRSRTFLQRLAQDVDLVLVAQCYLARWHPARWLRVCNELYGFPAEGFDEKVQALAHRIVGRYRPSWILAYGWENHQLVSALDKLNLPFFVFTDHQSTAPDAEGRVPRIFSSAIRIYCDETISQASMKVRTERKVYEIHATSVSTAEALLSACREILRQESRDTQVVEGAGGLDLDLAIRPDDQPRDAVESYLRSSRSSRDIVPRNHIFAGRLLRRPIAGFNPLIYASDNPAFDEASGEDPLAHFIRSGRPAGRWTHDIIRPQTDAPQVQSIPAAIHAHLHYPDLLPELLERLESNRSKADLVITTTSEDRRAEIERILRDADVQARSVVVCENRGRDLWPFIELLRSGALDAYEIVCHVHGKRSLHHNLGNMWREFLWRHLIGGPEQMVDAVLERFATDAKLGLVFAEEPHLDGWEMNFPVANDLARRAGIALPLPFHFDYPMGTMFWARRTALDPLLNLGLTREEIPEEPLPLDGTLLHALERLIPFLVTKAGLVYATTRVSGSFR